MHTIEASCKICNQVFRDTYKERAVFVKTYEAFKWNKLLMKVYKHAGEQHCDKLDLSPLRMNVELLRLALRGFFKDILLVPLRVVSVLLFNIGEAFEWVSDKIDRIAY
jgi:hypothetical protein